LSSIPILAIILVLPIQHQPNQPQAVHSAGGTPVTNLNTSLSLNKTLCWKLHTQALLSHHLHPTPCRPGQTVTVTPAPASCLCPLLARCKLKEPGGDKSVTFNNRKLSNIYGRHNSTNFVLPLATNSTINPFNTNQSSSSACLQSLSYYPIHSPHFNPSYCIELSLTY